MTQQLDLKLIRERAEALCDLDNITVAEYAKRYNSYIEVAGIETVLALLSRLEQAERNADTYQKLYEQRVESLEQAEQQVERVREFSRKMLQPHGQNVVVAARVVESLDRALDGEQDD